MIVLVCKAGFEFSRNWRELVRQRRVGILDSLLLRQHHLRDYRRTRIYSLFSPIKVTNHKLARAFRLRLEPTSVLGSRRIFEDRGIGAHKATGFGVWALLGEDDWKGEFWRCFPGSCGGELDVVG